MHILFVDDEKDIFEVFEAIISDEIDCEFTYFSSAAPAVEYLENPTKSIDLIASDYSLPGLNGVEFFKQVKHLKLPFMLVTGHDRGSPLFDSIRDEESVGILSKPVDIEPLIQMIEKLSSLKV